MPHEILGHELVARRKDQDRPNQERHEALVIWVSKLTDDPRQPPSADSSRQHPHSQDELRGAFGLDFLAYVAYAVNDETQQVRLVYVGDSPPGGDDIPPGLSALSSMLVDGPQMDPRAFKTANHSQR